MSDQLLPILKCNNYQTKFGKTICGNSDIEDTVDQSTAIYTQCLTRVKNGNTIKWQIHTIRQRIHFHTTMTK